MSKVFHAWASLLEEVASKEMDQWLHVGWRVASSGGPRGSYLSLTQLQLLTSDLNKEVS